MTHVQGTSARQRQAYLDKQVTIGNYLLRDTGSQRHSEGRRMIIHNNWGDSIAWKIRIGKSFGKPESKDICGYFCDFRDGAGRDFWLWRE